VDLATNLVTRVTSATFHPFDDPTHHSSIVTAAMTGIGPKDELEGLLISQMVSAHTVALECLRRANLQEQSFEGRKLNLALADRFMRTFFVQMEALTRYRKGGQQKVTVEHVHIYPDAKAAMGIFNQASGEMGGGG
jgi:hypothetical protein